ncbi:thiosulfate/3-mercaptopyruvate sulfurtransferase [Candidatus Planktophila sulfonica]|uniref:Sulfurtransferase n=1 Tax=Candidatus Planktophila sulfonica TaxID=1884904 RepID=A0A249KFF3_9ACTN|nr:sulfurtransferase [Candidatus Planktophila sulfonica]ASY15425.1 thiosulfate/3-mercaptopyruvate sulfurtransferase [Candidatus Planktophila sulfonica]
MFTSKKVFAGAVVAALISTVGIFPAEAAPKNQARAVAQPDWLEQNLDNPKVRIIEVSTEPGIYERGHIKNAVKFVWHTDLVDTVNRDIINAKNFSKLVQKAGISDDTTVVLYGDKNNWFAAWGAWIFNIYGQKDVRVLDGGRVKWEKDGRALTTAVPTFAAGNFAVSKGDKSLRATLINDVLPIAKKRVKADLIDIRSADEYNGKVFAPAGFQELAVRAGHIPGAINVPWGLNVNSDGTFKTVAELKKLYADKGVDGKQNIITYCRIGERSSLTWFVLSEILGYNVKNYDGSWTEYGNSVGVPIVNNAGTIWGAA